MTTVTGRLRRRNLHPGSFADITAAPVLDIAPTGDEQSVIFDGELDATQIALVLARMDSTDPANEAKRADLRADRDALDPGHPLRRLINYLLGESS